MRSVRLGRWQGPTIFDDISETVGDDADSVGSAIVSADPRARTLKFTLPVHGTTDEFDPYTAGERMRRQLRSLMENSLYKNVYFLFSPDPDLNSWVALGGGDLGYGDGQHSLSEYKLDLDTVFRIGTRRSVREARRVDISDRRLLTTPRDTLKRIYSTDFASLPNLPRNFFPPFSKDYLAPYQTYLTAVAAVPSRDSALSVFVNRLAGEVLSFDMLEGNQNKGDVVIYDRRGTLGYGYTLLNRGLPTPSLYWRLGETSGTTAFDSTANGRNGTYTGGFTLAQQGTGADGSAAVLLDGTNGRVTSTYNPFVVGSKMTVAGWVYRRTNATADVIFAGDGGGAENCYMRAQAGSNDLIFSPKTSAGTVTWAGVCPLATWFHYVITYDDVTRQASLYINGALVSTQTASAGYTGTSGNLELGGRAGTTDPFDGYQEDFAVWAGTILTVAQVQMLALGGGLAQLMGQVSNFDSDAGRFPSDLAAWYTASLYFIAQAVSISRTTIAPYSGAGCAVVVTNGGGVSFQGFQHDLGILPAGTYTYVLALKGSVGGEICQVFGGQQNGTGVVAAAATLTTSWTLFPVTFTTDGTVTCVLGARTQDVVARTFYLDVPQFDPQDAFGWEEVYGSDYPLYPYPALSSDVPVIDNGRCRVRYDATNTPGFRIDVWDGAKWAEQGKVILNRRGDVNGDLNTLASSSVLEWTPERAVVSAVMRNSADVYSREKVIITLQRGWSGPRIEVYYAPKANGTVPGGTISYDMAQVDTNDSWLRIDAAGVSFFAPSAAGTSVAGFSSALAGENWVNILRQGATYSPTFSLLSTAITVGSFTADARGYGSNRSGVDMYHLSALPGGYHSVHIGFHATVADQIMEAEAITLAAGTTSVADGAASGGNAAQASRNADAIHVSRATWPNNARGKYRVFARVRPLTNLDDISVYAKTGTTTGATKHQTSSTFAQVDLGEIVADGTTLEIHAWNATAARTFNVDRIEAIKLEDRTAVTSTYDGARDEGQAALSSSLQTLEFVGI